MEEDIFEKWGKSYLDFKEKLMLTAKKEVIDDIPHSWLDSIFEKFLKKTNFTPEDVEAMFTMAKEKLRERHLSPSNEGAGNSRTNQSACKNCGHIHHKDRCEVEGCGCRFYNQDKEFSM